jgi:predicted permease
MLIGMGIVCASLFAGFFITFFINEHESITVLVIFGHVFGYSISMGPICLMYAV